MKTLNRIGAGLLILFLAGCQTVNQPTQQTATETSATTAPEVTATIVVGLSLDSFKGATFMAPQLQKEVQLSDGKFESGSGADYELVQLLDQAAFGDLNGDGNEDAALLLAENSGGSGVFVFLIAMVNNGDSFVQSTPMLVDDRPLINSISIENGKVKLDANIHGVGDVMTSPSMSVLEEYQLTQNQLTLTGLNSKINGVERSITIESPMDGTEVSGSIQVKGSMPIGPFENNLAYRFYDQAGNLLFEGPFSVQSDGVGGAATFDNSVTLPDGMTGKNLIFVLTELSMADGSYLCLASVNVVVK